MTSNPKQEETKPTYEEKVRDSATFMEEHNHREAEGHVTWGYKKHLTETEISEEKARKKWNRQCAKINKRINKK